MPAKAKVLAKAENSDTVGVTALSVKLDSIQELGIAGLDTKLDLVVHSLDSIQEDVAGKSNKAETDALGAKLDVIAQEVQLTETQSFEKMLTLEALHQTLDAKVRQLEIQSAKIGDLEAKLDEAGEKIRNLEEKLDASSAGLRSGMASIETKINIFMQSYAINTKNLFEYLEDK